MIHEKKICGSQEKTKIISIGCFKVSEYHEPWNVTLKQVVPVLMQLAAEGRRSHTPLLTFLQDP